MNCCHLIPQGFCRADFERLEGGLVLDKGREETYNRDSLGTVRGKCVGIFLANIFRTLVFTIAAIAKAIFLLLSPLFKPLYLMLKGLIKKQSWQQIRAEIAADFKQWPDEMKAACSSVGFTLFYGTIVQGGSFLGLFDPLRGRKIVGLAEREWSVQDQLYKGAVQMAPCFQARNHSLVPLKEGLLSANYQSIF